MPLVGFLNGGSSAAFSELVGAFRRGLQETGYLEGQNVSIEYRWAGGRYERLPALAADLVNRRVAVIASTGGADVVEAAAATTSTVPIVFLGSDSVLKKGVSTSFNRPSGNVTGIAMSAAALLSKCLQFLDELTPKDKLIGVLLNPNSSTTADDKDDIEAAARQIGRTIFIVTTARSIPYSPRSPSDRPAAWSCRATSCSPTGARTWLHAPLGRPSLRSMSGASSPPPVA